MKLQELIKDKTEFSLEEAHRIVSIMCGKGWQRKDKIKSYFNYSPKWREKIRIEGEGQGKRFIIPVDVLVELIVNIEDKSI